MKNKLEEKIESILDTIRPYLQADGGDVQMIKLTLSKKLELELTGNCRVCKLSTITFKEGICNTITQAIPEITKISLVNHIDPTPSV